MTYFADPKRRFVLLTSFRKISRRTPLAEIERAERVAGDWMRRMKGGRP